MNSGFTDFSTVDPHTKLTDRFENQLKVLETIYKKASNENATVIFGGTYFMIERRLILLHLIILLEF